MSVPAEVEALIADAPVSAHLATSVDDRPHVAPVWYGYRDGVVYFLTGGRKLDNARHNPRVALSVEDARGGDVRWNVTLLGRATVDDDPERMDWARGWIYDRYEDASVESDEPSGTGESGDEPRADGGESTDGEYDYALVEVEVGSASWNVYE